MKTCSRCKLEKSFDEFNRRGKSYSSFCKVCNKEYLREHYESNKEYYADKRDKNREKYIAEFHEFIKTKSCMDCGNDNPVVLEFDHKHDKHFNISEKISSTPLENLMAEIDKCDIVCANCHRIRTANQFSWKKLNLKNIPL